MSVAQSVSSQSVSLEVHEISLDRIQESNGNPRRVFDEARLRELADNIKVRGVLQPVLVRPLPEGPEGMYELVAGARRFRASKLAGKQTIPATVREFNDGECREIQLIENLQRADIHELDEALGYRALRDLNPQLYTVETIAAKVGKSSAYIYGRMKLADLIPVVQTAFYEGRLTVAHALEIARLQPLCGDVSYVAFRSGSAQKENLSATECHITPFTTGLGETPSVPCRDAMVSHVCCVSPRRGPKLGPSFQDQSRHRCWSCLMKRDPATHGWY